MGWKSYSRYIVAVVIMVLLLWNIKPLITREIGSLFITKSINNDYQVLRADINKHSNFYRILWVPVSSRWHLNTSLHPEVSAVATLTTGEWKKYIPPAKKSEYYPEGQMAVDFFKQSITDKLLDSSSIKYIVVPMVDSRNNDDVFQYYGEPRQYYIDQLDKLSYLKRKNIGTKDIVVYENEGFRDHVYLTNGPLIFDKGASESATQRTENSKQKTEYQFINPTEYKVTVSNLKNPTYLQFAESYHPDWRLRVGEFHWWDVLMQKKYFLPDSIHSKNDAQLNQYKIDPSVICKTYVCQKNSDGSYTIAMTLYFAPQSYMYLGLIISITTGIGVLGFLVYVGLQKLRSRKKREKK